MAPPLMPKIHKNIMYGAKFPINEDLTIGELITNKLHENGSEVVLVDAVTDESVTSKELLSDVLDIVKYFQENNIGLESTVAVCSENRLEMPAPMIACLVVGATCAPLNPIYTNAELLHTLNISQPSVAFCSPLTAGKLNEIRSQSNFLKKIIVFGKEVESDDEFIAYKDLITTKSNLNNVARSKFNVKNTVAVILCSSGTTGLPKGVELTHHNLCAFLTILTDPSQSGGNENGTLLGLIPFFHGYGYGMVLMSIMLNIKIVVMPMFNEELFLSSIQKHKISFLAAVPPLLVFLSKHPLVDKYDLSSLKQIRCGAAPLSKDTQMAAQKRLNVSDIKQGYGMTELTIACVFMPPNANKVGSSGVVCWNMEAKVVDTETGKALPPYKEGELCFRGPFVMKGYKNNAKANAETIDSEGWLHTGDIGYYDVQGFLFIVDRLKELIKYKGFQVAPAELEALLLKNPKVKDAAVIGIPDEEAGELPFAFVVKQPDAKITEQEIKKFVAGKVSAQKRLTGGVRFLEEIPKNPSGKILRRDLRALYKSKL